MPQQTVVRLVTPADENDKKYKSRDAFEKELDRLLKKKPRIQAGYKAYYGGYDPGGLEDAAAKAVEDAQAAIDAGQLAAIVTAGQIATETVQDATMNKRPAFNSNPNYSSGRWEPAAQPPKVRHRVHSQRTRSGSVPPATLGFPRSNNSLRSK